MIGKKVCVSLSDANRKRLTGLIFDPIRNRAIYGALSTVINEALDRYFQEIGSSDLSEDLKNGKEKGERP